MNIIQFEETIKNLLQHNIEIVSSNNLKTVRKGTLILYTLKDFYMTFVLKTQKGDTKYYHFPVPYEVIEQPKRNRVLFRYDNELIHNDKSSLMQIVKQLGDSKSVFYDNVMSIEYTR